MSAEHWCLHANSGRRCYGHRHTDPHHRRLSISLALPLADVRGFQGGLAEKAATFPLSRLPLRHLPLVRQRGRHVGVTLPRPLAGRRTGSASLSSSARLHSWPKYRRQHSQQRGDQQEDADGLLRALRPQPVVSVRAVLVSSSRHGSRRRFADRVFG